MLHKERSSLNLVANEYENTLVNEDAARGTPRLGQVSLPPA